MNRRSSIPLMLLGVGSVAVPGLTQTAALAQQDAKQLADNIENSWVTDFNAGNAQAVAALFAPDGTLVSANGTVVNGQQAIQDALAATIKAGWPKVTTTVLQANMAGDAAWILGQYTYTGTGPNEGTPGASVC